MCKLIAKYFNNKEYLTNLFSRRFIVILFNVLCELIVDTALITKPKNV